MSDAGAWTGEAADAEVADVSMAVSRVTGFLPPRVERAIAREDRQERAEARRAEREREVHREQLQDRALEAFRQAAEERGEMVDVMDLAQGRVPGRSLEDIFEASLAASADEDARSAARDKRAEYVGDVGPAVSRSAWPSTEYEVDSQISRAQQMHRYLVAFRARHGYRDAVSAARSRSAAGHVSRSADDSPRRYTDSYGYAHYGGEISRVCTPDGNVAWRP